MRQSKIKHIRLLIHHEKNRTIKNKSTRIYNLNKTIKINLNELKTGVPIVRYDGFRLEKVPIVPKISNV